jgi:hypothetical protein
MYTEAIASTNPADYDVRAGGSIALVFFARDRFERVGAAAVWNRYPVFGIKVGCESRRLTETHRGAYATLELIRDTLTDSQIVDANGKGFPLSPEGSRYLGQTSYGDHWYQIEFGGKDLYHLTS